MELVDLIAAVQDHVLASAIQPCVVTAIGRHAQSLEQGALYVALHGTQNDGHRYCEEAYAHGACAVVIDDPELFEKLVGPRILVDDTAFVYGWLASAFFGYPSRYMQMVGITGTSGKTTTALLVQSIMQPNAGCIGTLGISYGDEIIASSHTTPDAYELQGVLARMLRAGCRAVVMEVSSHALVQRRLDGTFFDGMLFLNLSPEHLDYHTSMEEYFEAKALLMTRYREQAEKVGKKPCIVLESGFYGQKLMARTPGAVFFDASFLRGGEAITGEYLGISIQSSLVGQFHAANIAAAVRLMHALGYSNDAISRGIGACQVIPGRLDEVHEARPYGGRVFIDYAHKPDALEKVLIAVRALEPTKKLGVVFGCGGNRDTKKRPLMGAIASRLADWVIVTSDNPRNESPEAIIAAIMVGAYSARAVSDRREAICAALDLLPGACIVIAGKGHEEVQIFGNQEVPFSDKQVVLEYLKKC